MIFSSSSSCRAEQVQNKIFSEYLDKNSTNNFYSHQLFLLSEIVTFINNHNLNVFWNIAFKQQLLDLSQLFKTELHLPMHFYQVGLKNHNVIRRCQGIKRFSNRFFQDVHDSTQIYWIQIKSIMQE